MIDVIQKASVRRNCKLDFFLCFTFKFIVYLHRNFCSNSGCFVPAPDTAPYYYLTYCGLLHKSVLILPIADINYSITEISCETYYFFSD